MLKCLSLLLFLSLNAYAFDVKNFNANKENYNAKLQIFAKNNEIANFDVAIVRDKALQEHGLMNLKKLDEKKGMLFIFKEETIINMWMKNTFIALDMIFINENNQIVEIRENAKPFSLDIISSKEMADKVLEVNAGQAKKHNIAIGQKIRYENF